MIATLRPEPSASNFAKPSLRVFCLLAAIGLGAVLLFQFDPRTSSFYPKCLLHGATGLHCPGCGILRASHHLLHGDVSAALAMNPLVVVLVPLVCVLVARRGIDAWRRQPSRAWFPIAWQWVIPAVLVLYTVLRNIPFYPCTLLAPHDIIP